MTGAIVAKVGQIGFRAIAGNTLKGIGHWAGRQDAIHLIAYALALVCVWQFVTIHGLEFKLIPGLGPKIHIVSLKGKIADAKAETAAVRVQLTTSIGNETRLRTTITDQNKRVASWQAQSIKEQAASEKARQAAESRALTAEHSRDALRRSGAKKPAGPGCEPSDTLKKQWS